MRIAILSCLLALAGCGHSGPADAGCDQACQDLATASAITQAVTGLYNQSIAGQPAGYQDQSASCPSAGAAQITGTTTYSEADGTTTVHLSYALSGCRTVGAGFDLTLGGTLKQDGPVGTSAALTYQASGLELSGFAGAGAAQLDGGCDLSISRQGAQLSGTLCGRSFAGSP